MTSIPPAEQGKDFLQDEALVHDITKKMEEVFPQFGVMDRSEFDAYDPGKDDTDRGRILFFYTEAGKERSDPQFLFIFKAQGLVLHYTNAPEPRTKYTHRNSGDSVYGPKERLWRQDELDFALEKTKIRMEGVDIADEAFQNQLVGWNEEEQRFITMKERIDAYAAYLREAKGWRQRAIKQFGASHPSIWDLDDERTKLLVVKRVRQQPRYVFFDGKEQEIESIVDEVEKDTQLGKQVVVRELHRIEAQEELLKMHQLLS